MFTKSQYETIARVIKSARANRERDGDDVDDTCLEIASALANRFTADNPKFDRARFLKACGVAE